MKFELEDEYIELFKLLKITGIAESEAKRSSGDEKTG